MKILSLILDGHGSLLAELCVSPDLKRREIVAATGGGELIWCGLAAHSQKPGEALEELRGYIDARNLGRWGRSSLRDAARKAYLLTVILPAVDRTKGRVRRIVWRLLIGPVNKLQHGLAQVQRSP
jgi:hypothetical protein